jgi:hypothetical protein
MNPEFILSRLPILNAYQFVGLCNSLLTAAARTAGPDVFQKRLDCLLRFLRPREVLEDPALSLHLRRDELLAQPDAEAGLGCQGL